LKTVRLPFEQFFNRIKPNVVYGGGDVGEDSDGVLHVVKGADNIDGRLKKARERG
jgi:hypothetical protein